jgi:hypothetical protein
MVEQSDCNGCFQMDKSKKIKKELIRGETNAFINIHKWNKLQKAANNFPQWKRVFNFFNNDFLPICVKNFFVGPDGIRFEFEGDNSEVGDMEFSIHDNFHEEKARETLKLFRAKVDQVNSEERFAEDDFEDEWEEPISDEWKSSDDQVRDDIMQIIQGFL